MSGLPWMPEIVWGDHGEQLLRPALPCRPWVTVSRGIGGSETSAAGIPAAYEVRRDRLARVTLRFFEWEWQQAEAWIEWAQRTARTFAFRFDRDHSETEYTVYLESPAMGAEIAPRRSAEFEAAMEIDVELRYAG